MDVHRSTDAVLAGIDRVATDWPNVVFLATTNFRAGVDPAFLSRADLIEEIGLPTLEAVAEILTRHPGRAGASPSRPAAAPRSRRSRPTAWRPASIPARSGSSSSAAAWSSRDLALAPERLTIADIAAELARSGAARDPGSDRPDAPAGTGNSAG